jgi:hypothetical protein
MGEERRTATRREMLPTPFQFGRMSQFVLPLTLILLLVQNFTNSLQAAKMGAYLHAGTYVSPT